MFSPRAGTSHGAPREDATHFNMLVVKSLSSAPRTNAGAFAAMAAGASHSAAGRKWRTRRASVVTAAAAARRLLWLLDAVATAAQSYVICVQLAVCVLLKP